MSATQGSGAARVEDTIKDFWATRPRRPRRGRKIAGVAAGIGNRYRIDPVLVRVGLGVAAIYGGAGILVYLLGWLFLPEEGDEVSPIEAVLGKGRSSTSAGFTVVLCMLMVPILGWFFSGSFTGSFSSWTSLLVVGGLLYLLHQQRGGVTPVTTEPEQPAPATHTAQAAVSPTMPLTTPAVPAEVPPVEERTTPPAWDPLGAAPFAWDLPDLHPPVPEEPPPPPPAKRRKPKVATATVGIALVTVAGMSVAMGGWITPQHILGVVLGIVGFGMLLGAFLRSGRGLIALAVPLAVAGLAMTAISPGGYHGFGNYEARPTSLAAVEDAYQRSVGNVEVDLTGLPASGTVATRAHADLGNVVVTVPRNADVTLTCEVARGNLECLGTQESGLDKTLSDKVDLGPDGPGGLEIVLTASADTGNVEVRRG